MSSVGSEESSVLASDKILREIKKNPKITANNVFDITQRAVENQLASLKEQSKIESIVTIAMKQGK